MSHAWQLKVGLVLFVCATAPDVRAVQPALLWEQETAPHLPQAIVCSADGQHLFIALKTGGVAIYDARTRESSSREIARITKPQLGQLDAMNLVLEKGRLFVALGDFFAPSSHAGLAVIDVSNPRQPALMSVWKSPETMKGSAVVAVRGAHAFLGAMNHGVMVFDVGKPRQIKHLSTYLPDVHFPRRNPNSIQHPNARGLTIRGDRLFVAFDAGGLRVLDVRNPTKLRQVGRYINRSMKDKQQAYNNVVVDGTRAYVAVDYAGLEVLDISNVKAMKQVSWWNPWRANTLQNLWFNSPGHTNQIVYDPQRRLVFLSAGDSELQIVRVPEHGKPTLFASYGESKNGLGVWGLTTSKDQVHLGYIKAVVPFRGSWSGIKTVSLSP